VFEEDSLLKVGVIAMALAVVLVIVAVVVSVEVRGVSQQAVASETEKTTKSSAGSLVGGESPNKPWREKANPGSSGGGSKPGFTPAPKTEPRTQPEVQAEPQPKSGHRAPTVAEPNWSRPTPQEIEAADGPRHYDMPTGAIMSLTIDTIGIYGAPVFDSTGQRALANGVAHLPDTSLPWSPTPQRNVYLAGHRMGFRGTWSRMIFYNLNKLRKGDKVVLRDRAGRTYEYRVSETLLVDPTDRWVTGQIRGRDMLTLQTCTPIPTFEKRLIVRADRL
jgi:sortase A